MSKYIPIDKELYEKAKQRVKNRVKIWPSAYASGQVVNEYKRMGGHYSIKNKPKTSSLSRWYKEDWRNICEKTKSGTYKKCGREKAKLGYKSYPYCRPLNKVNKYTPITIDELKGSTIKKMCRKKRQSMRKSRGRQTRVRLSSTSNKKRVNRIHTFNKNKR